MNWNKALLLFILVGVILYLIKTFKNKTFYPKKTRLLNLLDKAEIILSKYEGGYSGEYLSAKEFHKDFKKTILEYRNGDNSKIDLFYIWFAPTCHWDDFVGYEDSDIANKIFDYATC